MEYPLKDSYSYWEIGNGALILLLLRKSATWKELCRRFEYADPEQLETNTNTKYLRDKLFSMRKLGLISFEIEEGEDGGRPDGPIKETALWSDIGVAFGGMSLHEVALISKNSPGMAVAPVFGRFRPPQKKTDVFALMPFNPRMSEVYANQIKPACEEAGLTILRSDEIPSTGHFMNTVWDYICAAELILADCTENNPNVLYEIGMAHTVGKKVVLITQDKAPPPSDIQPYAHLRYTEDADGVRILRDHMKSIVSNLRAS